MVVEKGDALSLTKGYKQTEVGVIPEDWEVYTFGNIVDYTKGFAFKSKDYKKYGIRIVRVSDTTFDSIKKENGIFLDDKDVNEYRNWRLEENDLIFTTVGSKPPMYDSMVGKVIMVSKEFTGSLLNQNAVLIRSKNKTKEKQILLLSHFRMKRYLQHIELIFRGNANQASITLNELFGFRIPLPKDEAEQTAIANALSDMDALIAQTSTLIEKKKAIKQGVMQELLKPKEGWVTKKLGESSICFAGGTPSTFNGEFWNGRIPWLPSGRVKNNIITPSEDEITITDLGLKNSAAKLIKPNSVLVAITGATCGNIGLLTFAATANQSVVAIEPDENTDFGFIYYSLLTMREDILRLQTGSAQGGVNLKAVKSLEIKTPPNLTTQKEISKILFAFDSDVDKIKSKLQKLKLQKQGMMQTLLTGKIRLG